MRGVLLIAAAILGGLALCTAARAAYLEDDDAAEAPARLIVAPRPPPPPQPVPGNPLTRAVRRMSVRRGYSYKGLTVFPVETPHVLDRTDYPSIAEALRRGVLRITEKGTGSVPVLLAENTGDRPILMLAGEMVLGGKQNRILREDLLLPASGRLELPVLCVERRRWSGPDAVFKSNTAIAALNVRAAASTRQDQEAVWKGVSYNQAALGVSSPTEDLQAVQDSPEVREAVADYVEGFRKHWRPDTVGMVVAKHGRIVGVDVFCNAALFRKHRDRILESYAVDCYVARRRLRAGGTAWRELVPDRREAERFLRRTLRAHHEWRVTPGAGRLLAVSGAGLRGTGLVYRQALLHASLFAEDLVIMPPVPLPRPILRRSSQRRLE